MRGVKSYIVPKDIQKEIDLMLDLKIDTILLGNEACQNKCYIQSLNEASINTYLIFPVFFNPIYLKNHNNSWARTQSDKIASDSWVQFVCPSNKDHLNYQKNNLVKMVREMNPTGITLDFIRNFAFWEMVKENHAPNDIEHGCFCSNCISEFSKEVALPNGLDSVQLNHWILQNKLDTWSKWKQKQIFRTAEMLIAAVKDINSEIKTAIHIVPWISNEYGNSIETIIGQNIEQLSRLCNFLTPMAYGPMCYRKSDWINHLVRDVQSKSQVQVIPSIQVGKSYDEEPITTERFRADIMSALSPPSSGILLWSWETLNESPGKLQIFKEN